MIILLGQERGFSYFGSSRRLPDEIPGRCNATLSPMLTPKLTLTPSRTTCLSGNGDGAN